MSLDKWQWGVKPVELYFSHLLKIPQIYPNIQPCFPTSTNFLLFQHL